LKSKPALFVLLVLTASLFLPLSLTDTVHATSGPVIEKTVSEATCGTSYTCTSKITGATPGDLFVADVFNSVTGTGSVHHDFYFIIGSSTANITDPRIAVQNYVLQCDYGEGTPTCNYPDNNYEYGSAIIYGTIATSEPNLNVQTNQTSIYVANHITITSYDVSGVTPIQVASFGSGGTGGLPQTLDAPSVTDTLSSIVGASNDFYTGALGAGIQGVGYSFSLPTGFSNYGTWSAGIEMLGATSGVPSSTTMPVVITSGGTVNQTGYTFSGAAFGPVVVTATYTAKCNFFQLQCWAYPMMFMGMYEAFFIGAALAFGFSEKGFLYFILAGATYASLIEISLGIMTPFVPISLIAINVAYSLRIDRLVASRV
jgi:hypothetical protein